MEYTKPDLHNLNKTVNYYNNSIPMSETVISEKLKDPNTLEQEMVNNMVTTTKTRACQLKVLGIELPKNIGLKRA